MLLLTVHCGYDPMALQWPASTKASALADGWAGVHFSRAPYRFALGSHVASGRVTSTALTDVIVTAKNSSLPHRVIAFLLFAGNHTIIDDFGSMLLGSLATNGEGAYITSADATCDGLWVADVDGDAFADVVLSAGNKGRTFVVWGRNRTAFPAYVDTDNCTSVDGVAVGVGDINTNRRADLFTHASVVLGGADRALSTRLPLVLQDGASISTAAPVGDVNGDGVVDTALGVMHKVSSLFDIYELVVVFGNSSNVASGSASINVTKFSGFSASDNWMSLSVSRGFDVTGDSVDDVLLVTLDMNNYIFASRHGMPTRVWQRATANVTILNDITTSYGFGTSAVGASAGDINADRHADIAMAFPRSNTREYLSVILGPIIETQMSLSDIDGTSVIALEMVTIEENDSVVAAVGDFNGDGLSDLFVLSLHAYGYESETMEHIDDMGRLYVLYGSRLKRWPSFPFSLESVHSSSQAGSRAVGLTVATTVQKVGFGSFAHGIGDSDGDSVPDVLISAPKVLPKARGMQPGKHLVISGCHGRWTNSIYEQKSHDIQGTEQFTVCGGIGDINGDGFTDIAVQKMSDSGYWIRYGPELSENRSVQVPAYSCPVGIGDVNGDKIDDVAFPYNTASIHVVFGDSDCSITDSGTANCWSSRGFTISGAFYVIRAGNINCDDRDDIALLDVHDPYDMWVVPGTADFPPVLNVGNDDGLADVVVLGMCCHVLFGKRGPWNAETILEADGVTGMSVVADSQGYVLCFPAGDVNNDSVSDFIVSVAHPDQNVWLYFGNRPPVQLQPIWSIPGCCTTSVGNTMSFSVGKAFS
eukprot:m51a1_g12507 hypothetical protein (816) ;mRNA; r:444-4197